MVSLRRPLVLVPGAGVVQDDLVHRVRASHAGSWEGLLANGRLERLMVGCLRVVRATWHLVIGPSGTVVMTVPLGVRVGRQHLCTRWIPLRFKPRELPGSERSGEVLRVAHGGEGQGPFQLPDAQDVLGLGIIPRVYRRQIWSRSVPVEPGRLHRLLATA